jgi:hypothetical protein
MAYCQFGIEPERARGVYWIFAFVIKNAQPEFRFT